MRIYVGDNKSFVWQWQPKEHIVLEGYPDGVFVHYANCNTVEAPVVQSRRVGDKLIADIPPELMQEPHDITVYVCDADGTLHSYFIHVVERPKPESYIYEPVEILRYESLAKRIAALEEGGVGGVALDTTLTQSGKAADAKAVGDALALRPVSIKYGTKNLVNVADTEVVNITGEFGVAVVDNRYTFTKLLTATKNINQKIGENFTVPESGNYTFTVYSERSDLGSSLYVAVYTATGKQMGYGFVTQNWKHSVVMSLDADTEYYYSVNTNYSSLNSRVEDGGTVEFWLQLETGESSTEWIAPIISEIPSVYKNMQNIDDLRNINAELFPLNPLLDHARFVSAFNSICCMGDSLTAGNLNYNDPESGEVTIPGTSYPEQLAIMTGKTVHNCGYGGATATNSETAVTDGHSYVDIADNKGWFSGNFVAQAYIIALATNDLGYYGGFSGDVSTDIDTADYTNNAKTSVGGYATIIQRILAAQPKAKIFCVTLPKSRNVGTPVDIMEATNNKIKAIAEKFGCYVIDLYTYCEDYDKVSAYLVKYYTGAHLNAMGYQLLARRILTYMEWIIRNNAEDFRNVAFIGTEYEYHFS